MLLPALTMVGLNCNAHDVAFWKSIAALGFFASLNAALLQVN
jgi:hypothetical protein